VFDDDAADGGHQLGIVAVVLLLGGAALAIAAITTLVPAWVGVVGVVGFAAGAVVPLQSSWRRRHDRDRVRNG
jgi:hypothetical protein